MSDSPATLLFTRKAELVSAIVQPVRTLDDALAYALDACDQKEACPLLISGCEADLSPPADQLCEQKRGKIIAVPDLVGATQTDAQNTILGAGLSVGGVSRQFSETVGLNNVISQGSSAPVATLGCVAWVTRS